jgi:glycosyltransferase involved in cell wall biosynthesis
MAAKNRFTLLENQHNLGFVATVNRGMRLHPDRDVVLLNSDTVLPPRWLDRMHRVAQADPSIGTVTPFSNNATICSFPVPCDDNLLPEGWSVEGLDAAFAQANGDRVIDIPTAVGFCMYIKRQTIDDVGYFDEDQFGKGYGEENDFCLRAATLGWRNVLACGVYVQHHGSLSFKESKAQLINTNLQKLNRLYPDYSANVQQFIQADPPASARNPVAKILLQRHASRYLLFVTHTLGGGTQVATDALARRLADEGEAVLELASREGGIWELRAHGLRSLMLYRAGEFARLVEDLRDLGVWHVHFHQTLFYPGQIWTLPERLGVRYDVTIHDYLTLCPRVNMIDETGWYCGDSQFSAETCNRCLAALGTASGVEPLYLEHSEDMAVWRSAHRERLLGARRVFFPSRDCMDRVNRHFNLPNTELRIHMEEPFKIQPLAPESDAHNIAVLGAIGDHKGYEILLACARSAAKEGLPLQFVVIGYTRDDSTLRRLGNVTVTGPYKHEELPELISKHRCRVAAFLSPWPETHCYALTEAWRNGLYPVAFDLGAQAERIRQTGYGELLPSYSHNPKQINRALLAAIASAAKQPKKAKAGFEYASMLEAYYGFDTIALESATDISESAF